jgi:5-methylcytosine-specific restriction endonuclease McrA
MAWASSNRPGSTRQSRTMRDRVLREEPTCRAIGCEQPSTHDDHIIGWSERERRGLTIQQWHARSNHQALCEEHHSAKTQAEAHRARTSKRPAPRHPGLL